jgi:hypothetical protein
MLKLPKSEMKLPSAGNSNLLGLTAVVLLTVAFNVPKFKFHKHKLYCTWQYTQVLKNGKVAFIIDHADTMVLDKNGHFHYSIRSVNLSKAGFFSNISVPLDSSPYKKALRFSYPNNIELRTATHRTFNIMQLSDSLVIREGTTWFYYKKRK